MNATSNLSRQEWILIKDKDVEIDSWFLMDSPFPTLSILVCYWLFVLKLGPLMMKDRTPFTLKNVLAIYNVVQILLSAFMVLYGSNFLWSYGVVQTECMMDKYLPKYQATFGGYVYFIAKVTELLDTVFFILRKKYNQASFLHIYHHSFTIITTWIILKYEPVISAMMFMGTLNSFVHVIMYTYYALSAYPQYAKYLWWKKYITRMQLLQFGIILIHMAVEYKVSTCKASYILITFVGLNMILFVYLFTNFYIKTYKQNKIKSNTNINDKRKEKVI